MKNVRSHDVTATHINITMNLTRFILFMQILQKRYHRSVQIKLFIYN